MRNGSRGRGMSTVYSRLIVPGFAVNTRIRSDSAIASTRSWVTNRTVGRERCHSLSSSACRITRVCASRGPNGSSISTTSLSWTRVRMIPARLRIPPDSSWG
jgi:hypothetical protein